MAEKMKPRIHLYFHDLAFGDTQDKYKLQGNYMEHLYHYFDYMINWSSPVDPDFDLPYELVLHRFTKARQIQVGHNDYYLIFFPMNMDLLRHAQDNLPSLIPDLQVLDSTHKNVNLCFDYAQESNLPGNFCKTKSILSICTDVINWEQWNVIIFSSQYLTTTNGNENGFKEIYASMSYVATWFFKVTQQETPYIMKPDLIYTHKGKEGPIRYFVPNNEFRPSRAHMIVAMHDRNMLNDAEWNMNSFKDWNMHKDAKSGVYLRDKWTDRYIELFGTVPKTNSYPWNKEFNLQYPPAEMWPPTLLDHTYIYIANETFHDYRNETNPAHVNLEITEKIWKGFIYGMPMLINSRVGGVNSMTRFGFDMMEDYLHTPYDTITDTEKRIDAILDCAENYPAATEDMIERLYANKKHACKKSTLWQMFDVTFGTTNLFKNILDK